MELVIVIIIIIFYCLLLDCWSSLRTSQTSPPTTQTTQNSTDFIHGCILHGADFRYLNFSSLELKFRWAIIGSSKLGGGGGGRGGAPGAWGNSDRVADDFIRSGPYAGWSGHSVPRT